jgi:hypothetical protein
LQSSHLTRDQRRWYFIISLLALLLLGALFTVALREHRTEWRLIQRSFYSRGLSDTSESLEIVQNLSCTGELDRCKTCHMGIGRGLVKESTPKLFREHSLNLDAHAPGKVGCTACHGGKGRALTEKEAHGSLAGEERDPRMREPFIQASCARCHVPGAKKGQERLLEGARLYLGLGCALCHPLSDEGRGGWDFGPDLKADAPLSLAYLEESLLEPSRNFKGSTMPSFRLALERDRKAMESLLIYLVSLPIGQSPGCGLQQQKSSGLVASPCSGCHAGEAGRANGRLQHECPYLLERKESLRCGQCHNGDIPEGKRHKNYCPAIAKQRSACIACHPAL